MAVHLATVHKPNEQNIPKRKRKHVLRRKKSKRKGSTQSASSEEAPTKFEWLEGKTNLAYLKKLDKCSVLLLNADYQPVSVFPLSRWSWQDAVKAIYSGKATVVEVYADIVVHGVNLDMKLPSVIVLNEYVPISNRQHPAFTRRNVFLRDGYTCQYCNKRFASTALSLDHVVPRCRGGKLNW